MHNGHATYSVVVYPVDRCSKGRETDCRDSERVNCGVYAFSQASSSMEFLPLRFHGPHGCYCDPTRKMMEVSSTEWMSTDWARLEVMDCGNEISVWKNRNPFFVVADAVAVGQRPQREQPTQRDRNSAWNVWQGAQPRRNCWPLTAVVVLGWVMNVD